MAGVIEQLRANDFVIFEGVSGAASKRPGQPYKFAKIDNRCSLMNNPSFLADLEAEGAKVIRG